MAKKKFARLGIERDNDFMYYIKDGAVWRVPRKKPGQKTSGKGKKEMVVEFAGKNDLDYSKFLYYMDGDGDIVASERKSGKKKG